MSTKHKEQAIKLTDTDHPIARGNRVKQLRKALRLSRKEIERLYGNKYEITAASIQGWETARYGGLTERGAKAMVNVFKEEGLKTTLEWLLYGKGDKPLMPLIPARLKDGLIEPSSDSLQMNIPDSEAVAKELLLFHQTHSNVVDTIITDDAFSPYFLPGDYVAGVRLFGTDLYKAISHICIVLTYEGLLVRQVQAGSTEGRYNLKCLNLNSCQPAIYDCQLLNAAPIVWWRRRIPS